MKQPRIALCLIVLFALAMLPCAYATVQLGPESGAGSVTLINPDNSTYYFDSGNMSLYNYVSNSPDGWWFFNPATPLNDDSADLWVIGLIFGIVAFALAAIVMTRRNKT